MNILHTSYLTCATATFLSLPLLPSIALTQPLTETRPTRNSLVAIVPLTGPVAEYGSAIKNGWQLAVEDIGTEEFGCTYTIEDSAYKSPQALSAFQKAIASGATVAYAFGGNMAEALAPVAEQRKFPLITDGIDPRVSEGRKYVSRYANTRKELGEPLVSKLLAKGVTRITIVNAENQYLNSLIEGFKEAAEGKLQIKAVAQVTPDETDLRSILPKLLSEKADAYGLFLMPGQTSTLGRLLKGKLDGKIIFGGDFFDSNLEIASSDGVLEGALFVNNSVDAKFRARYLERFHDTSHLKFAAEGYDVATMLHNDICSSKDSLSPETIVRRLHTPRTYQGAQGVTEFIISDKGDKYFRAKVEVFSASSAGASIAK